MGMLGLAIDVGMLRYRKLQLQTAADAAALAAALEIPLCNGTPACSAMNTAALTAVCENGFALNIDSPPAGCAKSLSGVTLTVNNGPAALGSGDPHRGDINYAETVVSLTPPLYFARALGITSISVSARAEAAQTGGNTCVIGLDPDDTAISLIIGAIVSQCGILDESASTDFFSPAFSCIFGYVQAPFIDVVGSAGNFFCSGTAPTTGIRPPRPPDPLAYKQGAMKAAAPSPALCGSSASSPYFGSSSPLTVTRYSGNVTLNPGTYCGGITIGFGANVSITPGVYTLVSKNSQGGLTVDPGASILGTGGVAFYNYGPVGSIQFLFSSMSNGNVTLTAPTTGPLAGILFFQDPQNTSPAVIIGSAFWNTKLTGASYFPSATVTFALDAMVDYDIVVANKVNFGFSFMTSDVGTKFYNNYSSLANGSPLKSGGASLVE
jgi:Putative Flp pilus-assembly TadE/G-like